jgi:hypothetical protein
MELDPQNLLNIAAGLIIAVGGWFARQTFAAVQKLASDLQRIEIDLPKNYVTKTDFTTALQSIDRKLDRIEGKIDGKVDKP